MLKFIRQKLLEQKQNAIRRRYSGVHIILHPEMPQPSINKMVEAARIVAEVNAFEPRITALTDEQLKAKTQELKGRIRAKAEEYAQDIAALQELIVESSAVDEKERLKERMKFTWNKVFEDSLVEAFAVVREVSRRVIGLRHFDVQVAGGIVLHEGKIAEMSTGEGKTLVATMPAYLNALLGKGVHIVTVNDYLARRDREWMGPIFEFLGLSVGVIQHDMSDEERQYAYGCDITYGTNNEFGFDYLRDNMKYSLQEMVQRPFFYAIVDEVDSILIDEARTPLIISGPAEESTEKYYIINNLVPRLKGKIILQKEEIEAKHRGEDITKGFDYIVDEKAHTAYLTEEGEAKACAFLKIDNLHDMQTMEWRHHIIQALRAHSLYKRDVDYVVKEGQVIIVDEFTGRMMPGRRWSDGLHQAVEAKEGLKIERENQTLATITFQNYFRMYTKLAGMTGTAFTEANEFKAIYKLDVVVIPTNRPLIRMNFADCVYRTEKEKFNAVVDEIAQLHSEGTPMLVGTVSIDKSERLADLLKRRGIPHQVLNAKYHEMEAQIVAQAGRFKGVTIATNMAGRGTDILLGGNPVFMARNVAKQKLKPEDQNYEEAYQKFLDSYKSQTQAEHDQVVKVGGLYVLGTERHEARRIDNQLRGRCGRQGDPGASRFYVSLEDDLMRLFGSDRLIGIMNTLGLKEGEVIEHPWVSKSIEVAQRRLEQHNFEIRKQLLEYDNVMNKQREVVYAQRRRALESTSLKDDVLEISSGIIADMVAGYFPETMSEEPDLIGFTSAVRFKFGLEITVDEIQGLKKEAIEEKIQERFLSLYAEKEKAAGEEMLRYLERMVFLQTTDNKWKEHLYAMDNLREGIGLRAYGQRDPLLEYKREGFEMFTQMVSSIEEEAVETIAKLQPVKPESFKGVFSNVSQELVHQEVAQFSAPVETHDTPTLPSEEATSKPIQSAHPKVGRNDPCPCGSGRKYKKCCGK